MQVLGQELLGWLHSGRAAWEGSGVDPSIGRKHCGKRGAQSAALQGLSDPRGAGALGCVTSVSLCCFCVIQCERNTASSQRFAHTGVIFFGQQQFLLRLAAAFSREKPHLFHPTSELRQPGNSEAAQLLDWGSAFSS